MATFLEELLSQHDFLASMPLSANVPKDNMSIDEIMKQIYLMKAHLSMLVQEVEVLEKALASQWEVSRQEFIAKSHLPKAPQMLDVPVELR